MATYQFQKEGGQEIKSKLKLVLPIFTIAAIGPLAMFYAILPGYFLPFLLLYIIIVAFAITLGIFRQSHSQLILDSSQVTLKRMSKPDVTILRSEVEKIVQRGNDGIVVVARGSNESIFIPKTIVEYHSIRDELNSWHPIEPEIQKLDRSLIFAISIIGISGISAIGAFIFRIKFFFYVFVFTFVIIIIGSVVSSFKKSAQKGSSISRSRNVVNRIILALLGTYFVYKIIILFF